MKRCKLCKQVKDDTEFGCKSQNPSVLNARCKDCMSKYYRERYQKKISSGWKQKPPTPEQKTINTSRTQQFYKNHPEKLTSKMTAQKGIKNGERMIKDEYASEHIKGDVFFKMPYCPMCGKPTPPKLLHGHHYMGYDHPTSMIFVCQKCHVTITVQEREVKREKLPRVAAVAKQIRKQREILNFIPPSPQKQSLPADKPTAVIQKQETNYDN